MKIGIMSDSHENMPAIAKALEIFKQNEVGVVLHAGDIISPITYKEFSKFPFKYYFVFGNNDGEKEFLKEKFKEIAKFSKFLDIEIGGRKIFMVHEPDFIEEIAEKGAYDVVIYGHTHIVDIREKGKTLIINPGETGGWLKGRKSVVVLETQDLKWQVIDI